MSSPFLSEIRVVGFPFAPKGWAFCNGQLLPLSQNTALFSLLGTMYGGDGKSNFALPDIQAQGVIGSGKGRGLEEYGQGEQVGAESVTLTTGEMAAHTHTLQAVPDPADQTVPAPNRALAHSKPGNVYQSNVNTGIVQMAPQAVSPMGSGFPHNNVPPVLALNYVIALQGVFPQRP
jgi:microcystin-dependent protein